MVFGRDIKQIPCFRESALNGIYSGIAAILITLLATSRPVLAADVGFGTFCAVMTGSFVFCRHQRAKTSNMLEAVKSFKKESTSSENKVDEA